MKKFIYISFSLVFLILMANPVWAGEKETSFNEILQLLNTQYVDPVDKERLYEGAIKGMLETLDDPYTVYFDTYGYQSFMQGFESSFSGIGVQIKEHDLGAEIISVFPNSPSLKAGLKMGDIITAADGQSIKGKDPSYAAGLIRGKTGTFVKLTLLRQNKQINIRVQRAIIDNPSVQYKLINSIGYLRISEFKDDTAVKTGEALNYFAEKKAKALILDLRNNPGGELSAALSVNKMLIPAGPILQIVSGAEQKHTIFTKGEGLKKPIVALINRGSASASEVVAGALQDRKAALLIGEKSFGKASVQSIIPLETGAFKMTIAHYLTPNGRFIHKKGIEPDIFVSDTHSSNEDLVLSKALLFLKNAQYRVKVGIDGNAKNITINNTKLNTKAIWKNGHYYLPLQELAQALGMKITIQSKEYIITGKQKSLKLEKSQLILKNKKGYVPLAKFLQAWNLHLLHSKDSSWAFAY